VNGYFRHVRSAAVTAKIPMITKSNANEYAKFCGFQIYRNQAPPTAVIRTPQAKVLKAPRSYCCGLFALMPASTMTQTPKKVITRERASPIVAMYPAANATKQTATITTNTPNERSPNGLLGNEALHPSLKLMAALWTELSGCQNRVFTFRTIFRSSWWRRNLCSAF